MKPTGREMVTAVWKEIHPKSISLNHDKPQEFVRCQWQRKFGVHLVYLSYRWFLAIVFLATMILSICDTGHGHKSTELRYISKWPIYLTNWGYTVCTIQAILGAWVLTRRLIAERKSDFRLTDSEMSLSYKIYWALNTTGVVMAVGITVAYWLTVYDPTIHNLDALNLMVHAFNSVIMVMDLFLVAHPFRLLHCYWPFLITVFYVAFSFIYYESGGTDRNDRPYVYPLLDWRFPKNTAGASVFGLFFVLAVHLVVWILFLIRKWIFQNVTKRSDRAYEEKRKQMSPEAQPSLQMDDIIC